MPESHEDRAAREAAWARLELIGDGFEFREGWQARGAYERERLADLKSDRDTWSDVANEMMHERNAARTSLAAVEAQNGRLRRLLHREHFFEAGRLGFKPPLYGEPCPPCNGVDEELTALASVPGATVGSAEKAQRRCPHGHVGCCGHHDLEDMPIHTSEMSCGR